MDEPSDKPGVPPAAPPPPQDPFRRLRSRFLKARGSRAGMALAGAFALVAFLAPFLTHRLPVYWRAGGETTFPLIREFFAPSDTTEPVLEKGVNFLLLFMPAAAAAWLLMNRFTPRLGGTESRSVSLLFGAVFAAALWLSLGGMVAEGGGKDWIHSEVPPVPEMDDIAMPSSVFAPPSGPAGGLAPVWDAVHPRLRALGLPEREGLIPGPAREDTPDARDALRRAILPALQKAIEGPAIVRPSEADLPDGENPGITDANLSMGINTARWNRILVEAAYPEGFLTPMRSVRSAFLTLAAICLLALIGLTCLFISGANQYALSPRWLVLLLLAAGMAIPFLGTPRHDHTPYRSLAAEGKGVGLFPLIPYGPNEQGFGPRLPPSWLEESPRFDAESVRSWDSLEKGLSAPSGREADAVAEKLLSALPGREESFTDDEGREAVLAALNGLLDDPELFGDGVLAGMRADVNLAPYLSEIRAGRALEPIHRERFNRVLLERAFPDAFNPVAAIRWKKPAHTPGTHLFGTDESGRDVLVRVIHGARVSLSVGFVSVFLATVIGLAMGSLAAYYGGWTDMLISRFLEVMICFPSFFLILAVIAVLDRRSIINIMLVIGLTSWTGVARLVRGEMLRQKKMDYVSASIALGASDTRTIFRHILPNAMAPVLVSISFGITGAILTEAGLSFVGFGVTPPTPTWGQLLSETRESPLANWWLAVFPGAVLFLSVLAYNMVGEALRDALDPRTSL